MTTLHRDTELLRRFVREGCEQAFATLVDRYSGLVYHTARRRSGDPEIAREVAQSVFATLARKAPNLIRDGALAGWLHRTALLHASQAWRKEQRRLERMKTYQESHRAERTAQSGSVPSHVEAELDEALAGLRHADRRAILLRFYDGLALREIGERLGKSEDAARKQIQRGLAKLARRLSRGGTAVSVAALTSYITLQFQQSAPASLSRHLAANALHTAPAFSQSTGFITQLFLTMSTTKTALIVGLLAILPLGWQQKILSHERDVLRVLRQDHAAVLRGNEERNSLLDGARRNPVSRKNLTAPLDLAQIARDAQAASEGDFALMAKNARIMQALQDEGSERLQEVIREVIQLAEPSARTRSMLVRQLLERLARVDPVATAVLAVEASRMAEEDSQRIGPYLAQGLNLWAAESPSEALGWYRQAAASEDFQGKSLEQEKHMKRSAAAGMVSGLFKSDPTLALSFYEELSNDEKKHAATVVAREAGHDGSMYPHLETLAKTLEGTATRRLVLESYLRDVSDREAAKQLITGLDFSPKDQARLLGIAGIRVGSLSAESLAEGIAWAGLEAPSGMEERAVAEGLAYVSQHRQDLGHLALDELDRQLASANDPDEMRRVFLKYGGANWTHPEKALTIAAQITSEEERLRAAENVLSRQRHPPSNPAEAMRSAGFSEADIISLEAKRVSRGTRVFIEP